MVRYQEKESLHRFYNFSVSSNNMIYLQVVRVLTFELLVRLQATAVLPNEPMREEIVLIAQVVHM